MTGPILIVDDDPVQRRLLEAAITKFGHKALTAEGGEEALKLLEGRSGRDISAMILDLVMPDLDGMGVLDRMRERGIHLPTIVQTAQGGIDIAVNAMRAGAFDFTVKPISPERLEVSINNALKFGALEGEVKRIRKSAAGTLTFKDLITGSAAMEKVVMLGERAAKTNIPILIEGESGVGKELVARAIQGAGERQSKPFVTVNCGAIPDNLVESILFGHEKGSFTGATEKHTGKFVEAHRGTLFLDEIGDLPIDVQVKLLRAVQESEVDPVGARTSIKVDIRLISATHRDLLQRVRDGLFREDLFYRLNVFPIFVPPLRDRRDDIPQLVRHFISRFAAEEGISHIQHISQPALNMLMSYDWPGNIRQLENAVFRAVVLCESNQLETQDFPNILAQTGQLKISTEPAATVPAIESDLESQIIDFNSAQTKPADPIPAGYEVPSPAQVNLADSEGHSRSLAEVEEDTIRYAVSHYGGRMSEVARRLGIGRSTLYRKLAEYGIDVKTERTPESA